MTTSAKLVLQEHNCGSGIAALAMLTGQTYQQVATDFSRPLEDGLVYDLARNGPNMLNMDRYLAERGFAVRRLYMRNLFSQPMVWPPEPFADVHLCNVQCGPISWCLHWVVMVNDGCILDPAETGYGRLADYYQVLSVAAVVSL